MSVCPLGDCSITTTHEHAALGEGVWEPKPVVSTPQQTSLGMQVFGGIVTTHDGPLECRCGKQWTGPLILPLKPGELRRLRLCDDCCEKAEAVVMARHEAMFPQRPAVTVDDVRLPYRDDADDGL